MFNTARLKLTVWYLLIIMAISILFSIAIFYILTNELDDEYRRISFRAQQQRRFITPFDIDQPPPILEPGALDATKNRIKLNLIYINLVILGLSSTAGYFFAGRTLKPIKEMVDEQNRFITDASHELRTPLTALKSEIEVNLRDKKIANETKQILTSNLEEVNNLQILSDNLIKLTQYQKANGNVPFEEVSLAEVAEESVKKVANLAKHKKILINNKIKDFKIEGDRQNLVELLVIFLDNAIKYSSNNRKITLSSQITDHGVEINIKDQGVGIAKEDVPHLFDRFYRADKSRTKTAVSGYGLGLSIAKQILDKHHGTVRVESEAGKGATFSIYLPHVIR